jgi:Arc/MetJ-type ribon-helix-helix transcriptional regulator
MDTQGPMTISIPPHLAAQMQQAVAAGYFESADEIIAQAMANWAFLYAFEQKNDTLRAEIAAGCDDLAQGRVSDFDPKKFKAEARKKFLSE